MIYSENERVEETAEFLFPSVYKTSSRTISRHSSSRLDYPCPTVHEKKQDFYKTDAGLRVIHEYTKTSSGNAAYMHDSSFHAVNEYGGIMYTLHDDPGVIGADEVQKAFDNFFNAIEPTADIVPCESSQNSVTEEEELTYEDLYWEFVNATDSVKAADSLAQMLTKVDMRLEPNHDMSSWVEDKADISDVTFTPFYKRTTVMEYACLLAIIAWIHITLQVFGVIRW